MGRRRTIDRAAVLDIAEELVMSRGTSGLTIDAVAQAAGITKGGVQYCFGSKDALIEAIVARWIDAFEGEILALEKDLGGSAGESAAGVAAEAHVEATRRVSESANAKAAGLMASLIHTSPDRLAPVRAWYRRVFDRLDGADDASRRARLAVLAVEGAFMLRFLGFSALSAEEWTQVLDDARDLARSPTRAG